MATGTGDRSGIPLWAVLVAAGAACLAAYAVLRVPEWRAALLALVPHRVDTADVRLRSILAPRSIAIAGAGALAVLTVSLIVPAARTALGRRLPPHAATVLLACSAHVLIAAAVVVNLLYYFPRQYGRPLWSVPTDEVFSHVLPQAWPDVRTLREAAGDDARIAFRPPAQDKFFLPALGYPIPFYDVWPSNEEDWRSDPEFVRRVQDLRLTHRLDYDPQDRQRPLRLRALD